MAAKDYINRLIDGDRCAFDEIYRAYKSVFIGVIRKAYPIGAEQALDLYHRALAALYNNVRTGRIGRDGLPDEKLQAYIINTGKWMSLNDYRKRQTPLTFDTDYVMRYDAVVDEESDFEKNEKLAVIRSAVKEMKMPCSKLLYLAIYYEKSHEEIASIMHYANARTVTTQRSRCTQKLIGFLRKRFKELGYEY